MPYETGGLGKATNLELQNVQKSKQCLLIFREKIDSKKSGQPSYVEV